MKTDRELLEQALMYLKLPGAYVYIDGVKALIKDIEARLAEDDEEPVGYITYIEDAGILFTQDEPEHGVYEPVYARPQTKARLTDEEIFDLENALPDEAA